MSRIWEALQKIDNGDLHKWAEADREVAPEEVEAKPLPMPNLIEIAAARDTDPGDVAVEKDFRYSAFEQVQAEHPDSVVFHASPGSPAADRFRLLRMRLRSLSTKTKLRSILVTSPLPGDGKTTVSLNLATALADQNKHKVVLIDADLHRGSVADQIGLRPDIGLKECLHDGLNPLAAVRRVEPFGWHLLQSGILRVPHPTELLRPQEFSELLRKLAAHFDWIVIDSPPVLALSDGIGLSQAVDGTLIVARAERTPSKAVEDTIGLLGRKNVVGLVLNGLSSAAESYSRYNKYYTRVESTASDSVSS